MEGWIMPDIRTSALGGIPFGNNANRPTGSTGQPYFNGEEKRLELYTPTGWQNIVSETPGVVSVSGNYLESVGSAVLEITGTNFTAGAIASVIGSNGVEVNANSTTVNSIVSISAVFSGLLGVNEPYDVKVTNTSNLFGLLPDMLYVNQSPIWQTPSGSLGTFNEQATITLSALSGTDPELSTVTYSLASGSVLPSGLSLNSSTGVISGTLPDISANTTYTFIVNASDGANFVPRSFSIASNFVLGLTSSAPYTSKAQMSSTASGTHWIQFSGMSEPVQTYYDNVTAGGGWLLAFTVTNVNGKLVNWWNNDTSMPNNAANTPNYFTSTSTLGSTATLSKSNAKNNLFNNYAFSQTMIKEDHSGTTGFKAYTLNQSKTYLGWFTDIATHDNFTNRVSSLDYSSGTMRAFTTSQIDFNLQLTGNPGDGGRMVPEGVLVECVGGFSTRTDGNTGYSSGWSGNILRNDSNRTYGENGSTTDHTAWVFVK